MKTGIVVPWRPTKTRLQAFRYCMARLSETFPDWAFYYGDSEGDVFNPAEARNRGCFKAIEDGCEVLVVVDADTILMPNAVKESVEVAVYKGIVSHPFLMTSELGLDECTSIFRGELDVFSPGAYGHYVFDHPGAAWVMTSSTFLRLNGWDERFEAWGFEDTAFDYAHGELLGEPVHRSGGICYRMYHEDRNQDKLIANYHRFNEYQKIQSDPEKMAELVSGNMVSIGETNNG